MRTLFWIVGGILLVSAAFFLPGGAEHIWQSMLFSSLAALIFLIALTFAQSKKLSPNRNIAGALCVTMLIVVGIYGWLGYQDAVKQDQYLSQIRETIETGIAKADINEMLLKTLYGYYSTNEEEPSMGAIFRQHHDSLMSDGRIDYYPARDDETLDIELIKVTDDSVVLVAYSSFGPGKNAEFKNYDGQRGHLQTKGILTPKGIKYEREN